MQESDCDSSFASTQSLGICINTMDEIELLSDHEVEIEPLQDTSKPFNARSPIYPLKVLEVSFPVICDFVTI